METLNKILSPAAWNWERTLETINHLGLAMVIAGWLQALVTDAPVDWPLFVIGLAFILVSLVRYPKWTTSP